MSGFFRSICLNFSDKFRQKNSDRFFFSKILPCSGPIKWARGGSGVKASPLAAHPELCVLCACVSVVLGCVWVRKLS